MSNSKQTGGNKPPAPPSPKPTTPAVAPNKKPSPAIPPPRVDQRLMGTEVKRSDPGIQKEESTPEKK
jgi:hypothetical protein